MIDLRVLREDPDRVRASQRARGEDDALVDRLLAADERRRAAIAAFDARRAEQKALGRTVAKASGDERATLLARAGELAQQVKDADAEQAAAEAELRTALELLPNLVDPDAPEGGEDDYVVLEHVGVPPTLEFPARDHLELGERLGAIDVERGAKVSGARFFYLTGAGALLEFALVQFALRQALAAGFVPVVPPVLVKDAAMAGTGFLGQAAADVYRLPEDELYLVGTSEVPLAAYHMDEVLDPASLPRRYVGFSTCFRREAGSYGKDTRGIIRVHQFDKVEMFAFCAPEHARDEHLRLLSEEKALLRALELPFRVIDVAAGDLGAAAARKYDCEAWLPSQARYREVTSTSNCTEFQARRLNVRTRADKGTRPVATLNGTLVAIPRTIVALLENHQRADGSVRVPAALQPILGREVLEPAP